MTIQWIGCPKKLKSVLSLAMGLSVACLFTNIAAAHPFHTTTAEMEFNAQTGRYEVSMKIPLVDFEHMVRYGAALEAKQPSSDPKGVDSLESKAKLREKHASIYMKKHFTVSVAGEECRLEWVGVEDDQTSKWLYFELVLPTPQKTSGETTLTNKVLCDLNKGQINTVVLVSPAGRVSLKTQEQETTLALPAISN